MIVDKLVEEMHEEMARKDRWLVNWLRSQAYQTKRVGYADNARCLNEAADRIEGAAIAQKRVNELEAALRFYADEWKEVGVCVDSVKVPTMNLERDAGFKARAALRQAQSTDVGGEG